MTITIKLNRRLALLCGALLGVLMLFALQTPTHAITAPTPCPPPPEPRVTKAAVQLMEKGWIVWMGDTRTLYVLTFAPGNKMAGSVEMYQENWEEGMPVTDPAFAAPNGLRQPTRGIGKLWRENAQVRVNVGWALKDAEGLMMVITQQDNGMWFNGDHDAFKISGGQWQEFYGWPRQGY